jgi:PAS domain S-box-containing protein
VRVVGALLDVTAHREAVEALRRQVAVFESISDGLVVLDMEGAILEWNRGAEAMLAVGRGDAVGRTPGSIEGISWPGSVTDEMLHGVTSEGIWRQEVKLRRRGGGSVAAEVVAAPVYDFQSRVCACVSIWRDLAERRRLEAHLQIADRMGGLWRIAAGLGHQLNNPLAALLSNLSWTQTTLETLAIGDSEKAGILDVLGDMAESARQMAAVVRDLATLSRGARALDSGSADVKQVVELTARIALGDLRSRAVVSCSLEPTPRVAMSEAHLGQVVQNILVEAAQRLEASRAAHGQIVVATRADGQDVTIEVRDNGPALTPQDIDHIFDPYYRTVIERPGSSLAMSVAFALVEAAAGTLTVTSDAAGGNVVRARVPILSHLPAPS